MGNLNPGGQMWPSRSWGASQDTPPLTSPVPHTPWVLLPVWNVFLNCDLEVVVEWGVGVETSGMAAMSPTIKR